MVQGYHSDALSEEQTHYTGELGNERRSIYVIIVR